MARLIGGSKAGGKNNPKFRAGTSTPPSVNMLDPSQSGDVDVVQGRTALAIDQKMKSDQLRKNKSGSSPL